MIMNIEKKWIIKDYIKNNPNCTYLDIKRDTKIKVERFYRSMKDAYTDAGITLTKNLTRRGIEKQKQEVLDFIKNNTQCTVTQIGSELNINVFRLFGSIESAYKLAGIEYPLRTGRNDITNLKILRRSKQFENKVFKLLANFGEVYKKIRIKSGIIDCLFKYNNKVFVVEIKDYRHHHITMSEVKQVIKYMRTLGNNHGMIICPRSSLQKYKNTPNMNIENFIIQLVPYEDLRGRSLVVN